MEKQTCEWTNAEDDSCPRLAAWKITVDLGPYESGIQVYACEEHRHEVATGIAHMDDGLMTQVRLMHFMDGSPVIYLGVYEVDTAYGGPEEGGWWYDVGDLIDVVATNLFSYEDVRTILRARYPRTNKRSSFGRSKEDYEVDVFYGEIPPEHTPTQRPRYS